MTAYTAAVAVATPQPTATPHVETEFERVDRLVRRLADHVNQLEASASTQPNSGVSAAASLAIAESFAGSIAHEQLSLFPEGDDASQQLAASISALRSPGVEPAFDHTATAPAEHPATQNDITVPPYSAPSAQRTVIQETPVQPAVATELHALAGVEAGRERLAVDGDWMTVIRRGLDDGLGRRLSLSARDCHQR